MGKDHSRTVQVLNNLQNNLLSQSRDPAVQAAILAQLNAKYGSGVLPDVPKEMSKVSAALPYPGVAH